ncbi:single tm domain protein [Entamoeba histolytica]|uniref:Single tm domain protein n=1 Tax=Entamoeba histolytica TaxID=5759 RepID=A0A175JRN3_ENTHI|nr:single tm domain protein [Entamoeba histolytica]
MSKEDEVYEYSTEMKIGGMMVFGSVFIVGLILLIVYVKLYKSFHSPKN